MVDVIGCVGPVFSGDIGHDYTIESRIPRAVHIYLSSPTFGEAC